MKITIDQGDGLYTELNEIPADANNPRAFVESMGYEYIKESKNSSGQVEVFAKKKPQQII